MQISEFTEEEKANYELYMKLAAIKLSKAEMLDMLKKLIAVQGSEEDLTNWAIILEANTNGAPITDYIFWPAQGEENLTAEEILEKALDYKARVLITPLPRNE
jgi:hypothetical protein